MARKKREKLRRILGIAKRKAEQITILPGLPKLRVPLGLKVAAAVTVLAPAAVGKAALALVPRTLKGKVITGTAALLGGAILVKSPKAREFVAAKVKGLPRGIVETGVQIGEFIEAPKKEREPLDIIEALKKAGLIGGIAAAITAAAVGIPKLVKKVKGVPTKVLAPALLPGQVLPVEVAPTLEEIPGEIKPEVPVAVPAAVPSLKNIFKPSIDINIRTIGIKKTFKKQEILCCP